MQKQNNSVPRFLLSFSRPDVLFRNEEATEIEIAFHFQDFLPTCSAGFYVTSSFCINKVFLQF